MHNLIFQNQDRLTDRFLWSLGDDVDLDMMQFGKDSKSEELHNKIEMDFESGVRSGVNRTPTFFVNGVKLLTYDQTYESLLDAVLLELEIKE
jgi:protein-disulfide isomerase